MSVTLKQPQHPSKNAYLAALTFMGAATAAPLALAQSAGGANQPWPQTFPEMLAQQYSVMGLMENEQSQIDITDSYVLNKRAIAAANGYRVMPLKPMQVRAVQSSPQQLAADYAAISRVTNDMGKVRAMPMQVAQAQALYDCYLIQQEAQMNAPHNLHQCEPKFRRLIAQLDDGPQMVVVTPEPEPQPYIAESTHDIYFNWDESSLTLQARQKLDEIRGMLNVDDGQVRRIAVDGYADRSGPADYNRRLSQRRVQSVVDYLNVRPVPNAQVDFTAYGETNLPVPTADGVREQANRVAKVTIVVERQSMDGDMNNDRMMNTR